ncbi:MAG TPA: fibronectin type III domain-containing protein [Actinomycetota bacterium]|nr:fibronectin type III domain-containing protein [Actinomycetota bacterium]
MVRNPGSDNDIVLRKRLLGPLLPATLIAVVACGVLFAGPASAADKSRPSKPGSLTKTAATETTLSLSWSASTDKAGVQGYRIHQNGTLAGTVTSGLKYVLTGLHCNTTYIVTVTAYDAAGNKSLPAAIFAKTGACGSDEPACQTPSTVFQLLLVHQIQYGCGWPAGVHAKQAIHSVRVMLAARGRTLDTWRAKKWHKVALEELDAASSKAGAWGPNGVLQPNAAGLAVQYKIGRVIRVLHWHNPELYEVSKAEKWALTAISWYISASEYNRHFAIVGATPTMNSALNDLKRADSDFFSNAIYRAWGRYRQVWQRVNGL